MSEESSFEGFGIPIPAGIIDELKKQHDRAHMSAEANQARIDRFLTELDVDGLLALRTILNMGDLDKNPTACFWDGQILSLLRYVHKVDPYTGRDPLDPPDAD